VPAAALAAFAAVCGLGTETEAPVGWQLPADGQQRQGDEAKAEADAQVEAEAETSGA
jgi:hypothetical protein